MVERFGVLGRGFRSRGIGFGFRVESLGIRV
jgi:hypothetical protein